MRLSLEAGLHYGEFSLDIRGEYSIAGITGIFGPSGCGKTTLLRVLAGLEAGARGMVNCDGETWQDTRRELFVPPHRRRVGYVFQDARLFDHLSVEGNLRYALKRCHGPIEYREVLEVLDLGALLKRRPHNLSGGEKQRVAIGRALLSQPRLLLLDEPLSALDLPRKREILPYLRGLPGKFSVPVVYVTHDTEEIAALADRVLLMRDGRITGSGIPGSLTIPLKQPGALAENLPNLLLDGEISAHDPARGMSHLRVGDQTLRVPALDLPPGTRLRLRIEPGDTAREE